MTSSFEAKFYHYVTQLAPTVAWLRYERTAETLAGASQGPSPWTIAIHRVVSQVSAVEVAVFGVTIHQAAPVPPPPPPQFTSKEFETSFILTQALRPRSGFRALGMEMLVTVVVLVLVLVINRRYGAFSEWVWSELHGQRLNCKTSKFETTTQGVSAVETALAAPVVAKMVPTSIRRRRSRD